jgi:hypothetical protein
LQCAGSSGLLRVKWKGMLLGFMPGVCGRASNVEKVWKIDLQSALFCVSYNLLCHGTSIIEWLSVVAVLCILQTNIGRLQTNIADCRFMLHIACYYW